MTWSSGSAWPAAWLRVTVGTTVSMVRLVLADAGLMLSEESVAVAVIVWVPLTKTLVVIE